ncbi:MAG: 13E12 repeat family protein [Propionibacteriaceae bacterium]|nr:13E12 repeat family protein [Propionibacteriaceae bacterium]
MANRCSEGAARILVDAVATLMHRLPGCWARVADETVRAPLWQARRIVQSCAGLDDKQHRQVDAGVSPGLGALPPKRLFEAVTAQVTNADPDGARLQARRAERFARTGGDRLDPMTGWVCARTDRADAIFLDATLQLIADALASQGDDRDPDQRRAAAVGIIANPAAAVQLIGVHTTRGMINPPASQADAAAVIDEAKHLPPLVPHTHLYVHVCADTLDDPDGIARVEGIGPVLLDQVKQLTAGSRVRVTKTVYVGDGSVGVDAYEIPDQIREQVIARDRYALAPWSSVLARRQDLDHIEPYREGIPNQTRPDNLAPQSRSFHRWKTHAGWRAIPLRPGAILWISPTGQLATVDNTGTHPLRT